MDNDEDEDVTFENSVLGQHIKDVGFENLGLETRIHHEGQESSLLQETTWQEVPDQPQKQEPSSSAGQPGAQPAAVSRCTAAAVWTAIYRSGLLGEEDATLLQHLHPGWMSTQQDPGRLLTIVCKYLGRFCVTIVAVSTLAWWCNLLPSSYFATSALADKTACLVTVAALGVPPLLNLVQNSHKIIQHSADVHKVNQFLTVVHGLRKVMKKAVRLVQESELVARGFTVARYLNAAEKFEQQQKRAVQQRQCPRLRLLLFHSARDLVTTIKATTLSLIQQHPLDHSVGDSWNYLAKVPLEEYGACVTSQDETDLKDLTDDYSISAVKAMVQLYNLHCSEYLQRLALLAVWTSQGLDVVFQFTQELQPVLEKQTRELQQSISLHQDMLLEQPATQHSRLPKSASQLAGLYTAVHSLDLHLQAALRRGRELTKRLEVLQEEDAAIMSVREQLTTELTGIKGDIEACRECWDEAQIVLDKAAGTKQAAEPSTPSSLDADKSKPSQPDVQRIPLFEGSGPVIQDEVFEAYTDPTEEEDASWDSELLLSNEERELKKKQKKEAVRMLRELRSVISVRAQDREERERRALERMGHKGMEQAHKQNTQDAASQDSVSHTVNSHLSHATDSQDNVKCGSLNHDVEAEGGKNSSPSQPPLVLGDDRTDMVSDKVHGSSGTLFECQKKEHSQTHNKSDNHGMETVDHRPTPLSARGERTTTGDTRTTPLLDRGGRATISTGDSSEDEDTLPRESELIKKRREELVAKVQRMSGMPYAMSGGVAAMAAARSQAMGLQEETIGDSDSEEEGVTY